MKITKAFLNTTASRKVGVFLAIIILMGLFANSSMAQTELAQQVQPAKNKTFFTQFIIAGGPIVWFILGPMSLIGCYLAIDAGFSLRRKNLLGDKSIDSPAPSDEQDLVSIALLNAASFINNNMDKARKAAADSLGEQTDKLLRKIEWFAILGNVAPMVGLLGTVFGMIKAFNLLGISAGQPRPDMLASAISVALITTFWGLLIAIPALTLHGVFRSHIETIVSEAAAKIDRTLEKNETTIDDIPMQKMDTEQKLSDLQKRLNKNRIMTEV